MSRFLETLGDPDLRIGGFRLWVRGRQFEGSSDKLDDIWLWVAGECEASGASISVEGAFLTTADIRQFLNECTMLYEHMEGRASLDSVEPNLRLTLTNQDRAGHVELQVEITPDPLDQEHTLRFSLDQSYLPGIIDQCQRILATYPVRGYTRA